MKYFVLINGQQLGPVEESQLLGMGVTRDTHVWREGMEQWQPAGTVSELGYLFAPPCGSAASGATPPPPMGGCPPPPYPQPMQYNQDIDYDECPKTYLLESILVTIFCCLPFGVIGIYNAAGVSSAYNMGDYRLSLQRSDNAKKWSLIGLIVGLVCQIPWWLMVMARLSSPY